MRPKKLRRLLAAMASGAVLAGAGLGLGIGEAQASPNICAELDTDPRVGTVVAILGDLVAEGWSPYDSGQILAEVVIAACPEHLPVLRQFVDEFAPAPGTSTGRRLI